MASQYFKTFQAIKTSTNRWVLTRGEQILNSYSRRRDLVRGFYRLTVSIPTATKLVDNRTKEVLAIN